MNRKGFLGLGALVAGGAATRALAGPAGTVEAADLLPGQFDQRYLAKKADVRQIWDFTTIDKVQTGLGAIMNAMNAFEMSYRKTHFVLIDLRGPSAVIYALDDAMWAKYNLGTAYQVIDPKTNQFSKRNIYYPRTTADNGALPHDDPDSLYQDSSLAALQQRGAQVAACHDALGGQAKLAIQSGRAPKGMTQEQVYAELAAHLIPKALQTPSGSSLIGVAQALGFTYATQ